MQRDDRRVKTMVQALAVAERQRDVTRSFSKKEQRQDDHRSTPPTTPTAPTVALVAAAAAAGLLLAALLELSSMTPMTNK